MSATAIWRGNRGVKWIPVYEVKCPEHGVLASAAELLDDRTAPALVEKHNLEFHSAD